eukprot:753242-Hanusia_phi.AAC.2
MPFTKRSPFFLALILWTAVGSVICRTTESEPVFSYSSGRLESLQLPVPTARSKAEAFSSSSSSSQSSLSEKMSRMSHAGSTSSTMLDPLTEYLDLRTSRLIAETSYRTSRRATSLYTDSVYSILGFVQNLTRSICMSSLEAAVANDPGGPKFHTTNRFQAAFYKVGASTRPRNLSFAFPQSDRCGAVNVDMIGWSSPQDLYLCSILFYYNPVNVTLARTSDNLMNGSAQERFGLPYPLASSACPLWLEHYDANTTQSHVPYLELRLRFTVPSTAALVSFPLGGGVGPFSYQGTSFQATCQQWFWFESREQGSWYKLQYKTKIALENISNICEILDGLVLQPTEATVSCFFDNEHTTANMVASNIFAIITEPTDCNGAVDIPAIKSAEYSSIGQFASLYGAPIVRQVCDKCNQCGGFDSCELGCDGIQSSGKVLDLCGVCGGSCLLPVCTTSQCSGFYVRYLGEEFSKKRIISASGLTSGVLFADGPCAGPSPTQSPLGVCESFDRFRLERYPYNSIKMSCWERSPLFDSSNFNLSCMFANGSLLVQGPSGTAGSQGINVGEKLILAGRSYSASSLLSPATINLQGTAQDLTTKINELQYLPVPHWNSKFPVQLYKYVQFQFPGNAMKSGVQIAVLPVNDPPVILFSGSQYVVQEDKATLLNSPPLSIVDDANDVAGSKIIVEIQETLICKCGCDL